MKQDEHKWTQIALPLPATVCVDGYLAILPFIEKTMGNALEGLQLKVLQLQYDVFVY